MPLKTGIPVLQGGEDVNEVSGQKPAGYDHLGHALRTVRHSGEGAP